MTALPPHLADLFPGPVIVTELTEADLKYATKPSDAVVYHSEPAGTIIWIQQLYTDADRAAMREQMRRIVEDQINKE